MEPSAFDAQISYAARIDTAKSGYHDESPPLRPRPMNLATFSTKVHWRPLGGLGYEGLVVFTMQNQQ